MGTLILILIFVVSILLGVIVLIQNPKGGGLGAGFGNVNQIGGVQRTADFLEKATWTLAIGLVVLCLASSWHLSSQKGGGELDNLQNDTEFIQAPADAGNQADEAIEEIE